LTPGDPIELGSPVHAGAFVASPSAFTLHRNSPNPFRKKTNISFSLDAAAAVRLTVYDVLGRRVATIVDSHLTRGDHRVEFRPEGLSAGVYHYVLHAGSARGAATMVLLR
jgi:hypothetical protein